jgi:hypothetical protein
VGHHHSKSDIVVPVIRVVPVAVGAADVVLIIVERPSPQHPVSSACACNTAAKPLLLPDAYGFTKPRSIIFAATR